VKILNTSGQVIHSFIPENSENINEIDLSDLPKGIYFISADCGEKVRVEKIVLN